MLDSSGFYYAALDPAVSLSDVSVFRQKLDAAPVARRENYEATHSVTWAKPAADGTHTMIIADHLNPRPDYIREESAARESTRLNSSHSCATRMPSSASKTNTERRSTPRI